jgi:hypothetical protein
MNGDRFSRRYFMKSAAGVAVGVELKSALAADQPGGSAGRQPYEITGSTGMRYRLLGSTGQYISVIAGNESFNRYS